MTCQKGTVYLILAEAAGSVERSALIPGGIWMHMDMARWMLDLFQWLESIGAWEGRTLLDQGLAADICILPPRYWRLVARMNTYLS